MKDHDSFVLHHDTGRDLTAVGEVELLRRIGNRRPVWVTNDDRDRVPFYQKPDPSSGGTVLNADLLLPSLVDGSFGGEVVGAGQRQNEKREILESLSRQGIDSTPYNWYIDLRTDSRYETTSGFGLGIERYLNLVPL